MEQTDLNLLESARKVVNHLEAHAGEWRTCDPVAETKVEIDETIRQIRSGGDVQSKDSTGATADKDKALEQLADVTHVACRRGSALARKKGDLGLLAIVNQSVSDLKRGAEEEVLQRHRQVRDAVRALVPNDTYRINDALVEAIDAGIATFESLRGQRDELVAHRVSATGDLDGLFARLRELLTRLDDEVEGLLDNEEFKKAYFTTRVIIDRPGGRKPSAEGGA
ncbi:hypothetical protein [Flaviaesturariibacter aridisoli]|uniref:Uncharacterized protein n=1 Tax=Flaviaesturariibacter aridisoli TaxID=2545761 RepID=A0A4R4E9V2_9BACT|nr:hypothetical protein [Flaviaesturariibacter aridisoli]TCZ74595.1 hypothetical protein E0486_02940 [Flaviaesturariibacter aridisoli]